MLVDVVKTLPLNKTDASKKQKKKTHKKYNYYLMRTYKVIKFPISGINDTDIGPPGV